jgi:murein DD-endopeptidase MepM/ murein hydrolase activator NlpD
MSRRTLTILGAAAIAIALLAVAAVLALRPPETETEVAAGPRFDLPVACPPDAGCIVRSFVDQDPGPGAKDWRCGRLTYDGHTGTDIRVPDGAAMAQGVEVLAAAPGKVLRLRDEMDDVSIRVTGAEAVEDREAGNSVVIGHGEGWETQYSHLRKDSIVVKPGDTVTAGQPIALIGLSGNTEFTHVHVEVRRGGKRIDPYTGAPMGQGCNASAKPLWTDAALAALAYREDAVFDAGFAAGPADSWIARAGGYAEFALSPDAPALVFWIDVLGHRTGDRQSMRLIGPDDAVMADASDTVEETRIQWFQFVGRKRPESGWPPGRYRGEYTLTRIVDGQQKAVIEIQREIELR